MSNTCLYIEKDDTRIITNALIEAVNIIYYQERLLAVFTFKSKFRTANGKPYRLLMLAGKLRHMFALFNVKNLCDFQGLPCQILLVNGRLTDVLPYLRGTSLNKQLDGSEIAAAKFVKCCNRHDSSYIVNAHIKMVDLCVVNHYGIMVKIVFDVPHLEHGTVYDGVMYVAPDKEAERLLLQVFGIDHLSSLANKPCRIKVKESNPVLGLDIAPPIQEVWLRS